ncbi:gliding motility-associated-like protein [Flavobacterium sp. 14A]|nr:gliding motility-associated-like protein [Flavobacterium sp. 14A]
MNAVIPTNSAPVAVDDSATGTTEVLYNSTATLQANDTDADGDTLTITAGTFATTQGGEIIIDADGNYTYQSATGFIGTDSYVYTVGDGKASATGTVTFTVSAPANATPVAVNDTATTTSDVLYNSVASLQSNDTDADGDTFTVAAGTFATTQGGEIIIDADGNYTYQSATGFIGTDTYVYTVGDGQATTTGTVTFTVSAPVNSAPVPVNDIASVTSDVLYNSVATLQSNDTDADGDILAVTAGTFATVEGGEIIIDSDGNYSYQSAIGFIGTDTYVYTVGDGQATTTGTVTFTVSAPANSTPIAVNDTANVTSDVLYNSVATLQSNDTDVDGDILAVTAGIFATAEGGEIIIDADGNYTYQSATGFIGTDTYVYTVGDGQVTTTGTVTFTVSALANSAPVAVNDTASVTSDVLYNSTASLQSNDTDVDGDILAVTAGTFATAEGGEIIIDADGNYTYQSATGFIGTDTYVYTVGDGQATTTGAVTFTVSALANAAPVAVNDAASVTSDVLYNSVATLQSSDTDADGDTLTVTAGTFATTQGGEIIIAADGNFTYQSATGFIGTDTYVYTVSDGQASTTGTVTFTVIAPANSAPVAVNDAASVTSDMLYNSVATLQSNDTDADGDTLTVSAGTFATVEGGEIIIDADGKYTYQSATGFIGTDTYVYTVGDGQATTTGTVTFTVSAVIPTNSAPVAVNDIANVISGVLYNSVATLQSNDTDANGDILTVTAGTFTTVEGGEIIIDADGNYTYQSAIGFVGIDTYVYTVGDGQATTQGTVTFTVNAAIPTNSAPVAVNDTASATSNLLYNSTATLQSNDTDADGDALTVTAGTFATVEGGEIIIDADGNYTYQSATGFIGTDTYVYTVGDGKASTTGTVTFTVSAPANSAPVAVSDTANVTSGVLYNSVATLQSNDTDANGDTLTVTAGTFTTLEGGEIIIAADGNYTYQSATGFVGTDSFEYTVGDGKATTTGTVTFTVSAPANSAPVAVNDAANVASDVLYNSVATLQSNDIDADSDILTVTAGTFTTVEGGEIIIDADGNYTYQSAIGFVGTDTYVYTVSDGRVTTTGTLTITVNAVIPTNSAPVAVDDSATATTEVLYNSTATLQSNDTDADGDTLTITAGTFATTQGGEIIIDADGNYTYQSAIGFIGTDTYVYTVGDGQASTTGTVTFTVSAPANSTPVAVNDTATVTSDVLYNSFASLQSNDTDADGDTLTVTAGAFATAEGGEIIIDADGNYTYQSAIGFVGEDSFEYTVGDGQATTTGTVTFTVSAPVNSSPVAVNDTASVISDVLYNSTAALQSNDTDADGDTLTVTAGTFATTQGGEIIIDTDGNYTFQSAIGFIGTDTYVYTVGDGKASTTGTVTFTVTAPVNSAPVAVNDTANVTSDVLYNSTAALQSNDTDADGDTLTVTAGTFTTVEGGEIIIVADGNYTYQSAIGFIGTDSYVYTVGDGQATTTGTVTFTVSAPANSAPVAVNDTASVTSDVLYNSVATLQSNDTDADGDTLTVTAGTFATVEGGEIIIDADGNYTYQSANGFIGTDSYVYTVGDGQATTTGTVTFTVSAPVNSAPVAVNDTASVTSDVLYNSVATLQSNDTDADGDTLTVTAGTFTTAEGGEIIIGTDGNYTYQSPTAFIGTDAYVYTVGDGQATATGTVTFTVSVPANSAPVAVNDTATTTSDVLYNSVATLQSNDTDADDDTLTVTAGTFATAEGGEIIIGTDGNYTYQSPTAFIGTDAYVYTVGDGQATATGTVTFTVSVPANSAPVAVNDTATTTSDVLYNSVATLQSNDTDADGDTLTVTAGTFTTVEGGEIIIGTDGNYTYQSAIGFVGEDSFEYTVGDGKISITGTVTFTVNAVSPNNTEPIANADFIAINSGEPAVLDVLQNDVFAPGSVLNVTISSLPKNGTITVNNDGTINYVPNIDFTTGQDTFTYQVCTTAGLCSAATVTLAIIECVDISSADCDSDGVTNQDESVLGTDPLKPDTDGDGLTDGEEVTLGTNPLNLDTDGDGLKDGEEVILGTDPLNPDTDGDGVIDGVEVIDTTNPLNGCDSLEEHVTVAQSINFLAGDCDGDGFANGEEIGVNPTNPRDTDGDGIPDYLEPNNKSEKEIHVNQLITPNGDGFNDILVIENLDSFPNNSVRIYNRWGVLVWDTKGYNSQKNFFYGKSTGRLTIGSNDMLPSGTYFYVINYVNKESVSIDTSGYIYIN